MECPHCHYQMQFFETVCPRCNKNAQDSAAQAAAQSAVGSGASTPPIPRQSDSPSSAVSGSTSSSSLDSADSKLNSAHYLGWPILGYLITSFVVGLVLQAPLTFLL